MTLATLLLDSESQHALVSCFARAIHWATWLAVGVKSRRRKFAT